MSSLLITILLFVGASVQTLIPPWAFIGSLEWPVLTGLLIYIAMRARFRQVIYAAVLTGLLYGVLSPAPLGVAMPFFLLLSIGLYALRDEIFSDQIVTYSVLGLLSVLFKTVYFTIVFSASGLRPLQPGAAVVRIAGGFILGSLTAPVIYLFVSALRHMLPKSRRRI